MTMRSKGSSKIIGAAIAAMTAPDSRTPRPRGMAIKTATNRTTAAAEVTIVVALAGGALSDVLVQFLPHTQAVQQATSAASAMTQARTMKTACAWPALGTRTGWRNRVPAYARPPAAASRMMASSSLAVPA
jgi:hypothetical protein